MDVVLVAERVAEMPAGPELAAVLAETDLAGVPNGLLVGVLRARARQLAHEQAGLLACLVEVGRADPADLDGVRRRPVVGRWVGGEIAAALTLTGVAADRELEFERVVTGLPLVHAALSAGSIDRAKAWVFADHLREVAAGQAAVICAALVPVASGLTTGQLRARLARMLHDIDPDHARRRYRRAVRERGVVGYLAPDGSVTLTATGLPTDEAAVACERLDSLAHRVRRAGHRGLLERIQTDLFLGMLDGRFHHHTEQQIIEALLREPRPEDTADPDPEPDGEAGDPVDSDLEGGDPEGGDPEASDSDPEAGDPEAGDPVAGTDVGSGDRLRVGVEIRVGLRTLLGLDDRCGDIPGLGPVLPGVARALVAAQHHGAQWRFAITDTDGLLILAGVTRRRPITPTEERGTSRSGVVELHIGADQLLELAEAPAECGPWATVIADLAARYAERDRLPRLLDDHPDDRFARDALARHVETRDRTCRFPGCRRPARRCQKDHTLDHANGGTTTTDNTGPLCERHHHYKTAGWWTLVQPRPGHYRWRSPLNHTYRTRGEPIRPPTVPPHPRPPGGRRDVEQARADPGPILRRPIRRSTPPPRDDAAATDTPPF